MASAESLDLGEVFKKEWDERVRRPAESLTASEGYRKSKSLLYRFGMMTDDASSASAFSFRMTFSCQSRSSSSLTAHHPPR